jgi:hypothetical protein
MIDTVICTRLTASAQITTKPCYYFGCKAPVKSSGTIDVYNEGSDTKTAAKHIVPQYSNSTAEINDMLPKGVHCPNGLYVALATADEAYIYWN